MPERETVRRARQDKRQGKAPSTQAAEFVREEIHHIREGKHGAASTRQAIAIGLSKARRAGVALPAPKPGKTSAATRRQAVRDRRKGGRHASARPNPRRSRAMRRRLKGKGRKAASKAALSRQATRAARARSPRARSQQAKRAAHTRARMR